MPALQIGLNKPGTGAKGSSKPAPAKRKPIFGDDEDGDDDDNQQDTGTASKKNGFQEITTFDETSPSPPPTSSAPAQPPSGSAKPALKPKFPLQQHTPTAPNLSALRTQTQHTADVDPSLYDYDAAYDALHAKPSKAASGGSASADPQPQYMDDLLAAAEVRKRDQLRAKERLLQKEREAEGDEFKDKDMFVTEAYKAQQAEAREAEAREREREAGEAKRREKGLGMTSFYRGFMEQEEKKHQELVEAAARGAATAGAEAGGASDGPKEKSDLEMAKEMKERGKDVGINEEGQVLDKRELLSAGLNVAPKPKSADADKSRGGSAAVQQHAPMQDSRGRGDARKAMRERQTRMIEAQLEQAAKRDAEEEAEEKAKMERAAKSQKTQGDISSARERYLQRKKEAAAAAARGE